MLELMALSKETQSASCLSLYQVRKPGGEYSLASKPGHLSISICTFKALAWPLSFLPLKKLCICQAMTSVGSELGAVYTVAHPLERLDLRRYGEEPLLPTITLDTWSYIPVSRCRHTEA